MKNENNQHGKNVHVPLKVNITLDELRFLRGLLENLADRRKDIGFASEKVPESYTAVETSSVEAYVSGDIKISHEDIRFNVPYITAFIFTCTKAKGGVYGMSWLSSLS